MMIGISSVCLAQLVKALALGGLGFTLADNLNSGFHTSRVGKLRIDGLIYVRVSTMTA